MHSNKGFWSLSFSISEYTTTLEISQERLRLDVQVDIFKMFYIITRANFAVDLL